MARLDIAGLSKAYGDLRVLDNLTLTVARGEVVAVRGASGTGKSTLLNCIGLLDRPDAGSIVLDEQELTTMGDALRTKVRATGIGFVFQGFHLLPEFSALENVVMPARCADGHLTKAHTRAKQLIAAVGLAGREHADVRTLSGGERQRLAVCRALVLRPALILADEPTGNLDPATSEIVLNLLLDLARADGAAVLLVTHDDAVAAQADRRLLLEHGCLRATDMPSAHDAVPAPSDTAAAVDEGDTGSA